MIIALIVLVLIGAGLIFISPMLAMRPSKTGPISGTNIMAVNNGMVAVYLVKTDGGYIMIDSGPDAIKFEASLAGAGVKPDEIKWILLTHSDSDHTGALSLFPEAEIYMGRDELPLLDGTTKRSFRGGNKMPSGIRIDKINLLSDGQQVSFDRASIKCISAPGHTPGSMLYLLDEKYLFTGDAIRIGKNNKVHPFTMNSAQSMKTIDRLKETVNRSLIVLTSHYGIKTN